MRMGITQVKLVTVRNFPKAVDLFLEDSMAACRPTSFCSTRATEHEDDLVISDVPRRLELKRRWREPNPCACFETGCRSRAEYLG